MAKFLLIHGSCHGAWCWHDVALSLRGWRHEVHAIDLPAHGDDKTAIADVTLDRYARTILAAAEADTILVGHSSAGFPITLAAEIAPERFSKLVYLCAYVPISGASLVEMRKDGPSQPLLDAIITAEDGQSFSFDPAKVRDKLYNDCGAETVGEAVAQLCPEPIRPQATPVTVDKARRVDSHYIICDEDQAIPPVYQMMMSAHFPRNRVYNMRTSHSPFLSQPEALADLLHQISKS